MNFQLTEKRNVFELCTLDFVEEIDQGTLKGHLTDLELIYVKNIHEFDQLNVIFTIEMGHFGIEFWVN